MRIWRERQERVMIKLITEHIRSLYGHFSKSGFHNYNFSFGPYIYGDKKILPFPLKILKLMKIKLHLKN